MNLGPWIDECICKVLCCVTSLVAVILTAVNLGTIICLIMQNYFNRRGTSDISPYQSQIIARQKSCLGIFIAKRLVAEDYKVKQYNPVEMQVKPQVCNPSQGKKPSPCFCINAFFQVSVTISIVFPAFSFTLWGT